jgi:hypothetical protein
MALRLGGRLGAGRLYGVVTLGELALLRTGLSYAGRLALSAISCSAPMLVPRSTRGDPECCHSSGKVERKPHVSWERDSGSTPCRLFCFGY